MQTTTETPIAATKPGRREISNIRKRLERWELPHLRTLAAGLHEQLEAAEQRASWAEGTADMWRDSFMMLQEEMQDQGTDVQIGLTQSGNVVVLKPNAAAAAAEPAIPTIGQRLPDLAGVYAGIAGDTEGGAPGHLVLLDATPANCLSWKDGKAWAESLGDGARLPTKAEAALLFANVKDQFAEDWHWTGTQYSDGSAFCQDFGHGSQRNYGKSYGGRCRAVRRLALQSFNTLDGGAK